MKAGETIGPFHVDREIGRGGMGVVYLAHDTRLDRAVAIKALPDFLAGDPQRLLRFEREARTLASLNHPNIAGIHAVEEAEGRKHLVLEYVEGRTLAERLDDGPLAIDEAIEVCIQIAQAVEAAHEAGVIHRDLKPGNVKITPEGKVKVLDFGLAKTAEATSGSSIVTQPGITAATTPHSPHSPTVPGAILGTAPYMSPEQARGRAVDKRSDVWSFGVILYECLTGAGPFAGETITDSIGAILHKDVDLALLPPGTPRQVIHVLRRCMERDKSKRMRDIGDARLELEEALRDPASGAIGAPAATRRRDPLAAVALLLLAAAAGVALGAWATRVGPFARQAPAPRVVRAAIGPAAGTEFYLPGTDPGPAKLSPDGSAIVFSARDESGLVQLWIRRLDEAEPAPLPGTEGAQYPFWSPDSRSIGFFSDGKLRRVPASGGAVVPLASAGNGKGGAWSSEGAIIYAPEADSAIYRVPEAGGEGTPLTALPRGGEHTSHRHPVVLPDGKHFLYLARPAEIETVDVGNDIFLASLDSPGDATLLLHSITNVEYASGHLLYVLNDVLLAQPFDARTRTLTGDPVAVTDHVNNIPAAALGIFSASQNGMLIYQIGQSSLAYSQLAWYDRQGNRTGAVGEPMPCFNLALSPDARLIALTLNDPQRGTSDIWTLDIERDIKTRLTFEPTFEAYPVFTPDSREIYFFSDRTEGPGICAMSIAGFDSMRVVRECDPDLFPTSFAPDGVTLACFEQPGSMDDSRGVYLLGAEGEEPRRIARAPGSQVCASFSPDGRLIAYGSNESGDWNVYVTTYPELSRKWPVSRDGGGWPTWSSGGSELFFIDASGGLMVCPIEATTDGVNIGTPTPVPDLRASPGRFRTYDVSPDGQRIIVIETAPSTNDEPLTLVVNWTAELERQD